MTVITNDVAGSVSRFLDTETISRINRPTAQATGLPNVAFVDPEFLALEKRLLFRRTWMCAGFVHELAEPGDLFPTVIGDVPIVPGARQRWRYPCLSECLPAPRN